jgi:hypothetical protein
MLPLELCFAIARYINHRDYRALRNTCGALYRMAPVQFVYFKCYKESVLIYNELLRRTPRIRLDTHSLDDESFVYIAVKGHSNEFIRLLQSNANDNISAKAKNNSLTEIIKNGHPPEMVCELLKDDCVNASMHVSFIYRELKESKYNGGTVLHWACIYGYADVALQLLKNPKVDVCAKAIDECHPIHHAASIGHTDSNLF